MSDQPSPIRIGSEPWIATVEWTHPEFDDEGFYWKDKADGLVRWSQIIQIAWGYEIHPIDIADWDFWAFRTTDDSTSHWVMIDHCEKCNQFTNELARRFEFEIRIPPMREWSDQDLCVRAYTLWPERKRGDAMYLTVQRTKWASDAKLAYPPYHAG